MVENGSFYPESKEKIDAKPYVVSADIQLLLQRWAEDKNFSLPSKDFFVDLRRDFSGRMKRIFPGFELVPEEELSSGLTEIVARNGIIPVSLDRVYFQTDPRLDLARVINSQGEGKGLGRRAATPSLLSQFRAIQDIGIREVSLVDDVVFTGDIVERVAKVFNRMGIEVPKIYAGIAIKEGIERLKQSGREVQCVRQYDEVIDEVCERDFYPGVPYSGRLMSEDGNKGAPYILPFGNPVDWASIPVESQVSFSQFCIDQSSMLFEAIEKASGRHVMCSDLDRRVVTLPTDNTRFIDALRRTR